jgi:hypothetical protein
MWSVRVLWNLEFLIFLKVPGFRIRIFLKLQFPPEVTRHFPPIIFSKNLLFPQFLPHEMEMVGCFFINGGLLPNSWVSRLKIFVSERTSNPSPMCLRGATPTKSMSEACGVFFTRSNLESTMMPYQNKVQWDENETAGAEAQINIASKIIDNDNEPEVDSE